MKKISLILVLTISITSFFCSRSAEPIKIADIGEKEYQPEEWGKVYPFHYELFMQTGEPTETGLSFYKRGWDDDGKIYDKLSQFPFLALLYNGFGFGIEYNEPRGHFFMLSDVLEIDASRRKPGGVCLTCKSSYAQELFEKHGVDFFSKPFADVLEFIPQKHRTLGVSCISCHDPGNMSLRILNSFTLIKALEFTGTDIKKLTHQDMRSLVCAQCHVTYVVRKDSQMNSVDLFFPWQKSRYGKISIEDIISVIRSEPAYLEWTQALTGFRLGFIRHPEFELFSNNSVHWSAGLSCADCHMPFTRAGSYKISDHRVMSPLKNRMKACLQCHGQSEEWLRARVKFIQDRAISLYIRAGYATATCAKLFELTRRELNSGIKLDQQLFVLARENYEQAFYRLVFFGAENSVGFHNPPEAMRILGDAALFASRCEGLLRQLLASSGIQVPEKVDLELQKYLQDRGQRRLQFKREMEFADPFGE